MGISHFYTKNHTTTENQCQEPLKQFEGCAKNALYLAKFLCTLLSDIEKGTPKRAFCAYFRITTE